ncbi:MAG: Rrf2 family transcriptional regulator [Verrucomicrobiota bacterium]
MKLSLRGEYALRALVVLGMAPPNSVVPIQTISREQNIPKRFLEQILNDLRAGGFLVSKRGISGGYRLALPPEKLPLASVIRHVEGALAPVSCVSEKFYGRCTCPNEAQCGIRSVMKEVRDAIVNILENVSVGDLASAFGSCGGSCKGL